MTLVLLVTLCQVRPAGAQVTAQPEAAAGALSALPARGLAAAIAEASSIEVPAVDPSEVIAIRAAQASRWTEGSYDVWHLTGGVRIEQGPTVAESHEAVVWIEQDPGAPSAGGGDGQEPFGDREADGGTPLPPLRGMLVRMAGNVSVTAGNAAADGAEPGLSTVRGPRWTGRFWTRRDPRLQFASVVPPSGTPPVYEAVADVPAPVRPAVGGADPAASGDGVETVQFVDRDRGTDLAQFSEFGAPAPPPVTASAPVRRLRAFPRSSVPLSIRWFPSPGGGEWVAVITSGVNLVIDGVDPAGPLDIAADRVVIWTRSSTQPDLDGSAAQSADAPLELYLEGNVVFRQGQRVVEAMSMFYDVPRSSGVITGATVLTPVDNYAGLVRLRADVIRQVDRSRGADLGVPVEGTRVHRRTGAAGGSRRPTDDR